MCLIVCISVHCFPGEKVVSCQNFREIDLVMFAFSFLTSYQFLLIAPPDEVLIVVWRGFPE